MFICQVCQNDVLGHLSGSFSPPLTDTKGLYMEYRNPVPTVDIIIEVQGEGIVLIDRENEPHGWSLPGGYVDYGETLESAALREAKEETCL